MYFTQPFRRVAITLVSALTLATIGLSTPAHANGFTITIPTSPSSPVTSGVVFATQPVVHVLDPSSAPAFGDPVTATLVSGAGTLHGTNAIPTGPSGDATFTDLSITGPSGNYTLQFTEFASGAFITVPVVLSSSPPPTTYTVTYNANTGTGTPPTDSSNYTAGQTVTVIFGPTISLTNYTFAGWCDHQPAPGASCSSASGNFYSGTGNLSFSMGSANVILYAVWAANTPSGMTPTITVVAGSSTATVGAGISFTATVSGPPMGVTPTGTGSWLVGLITGTPITCPLGTGPNGSSNVATYTCTLTATQAGQYGAGFIYGGDSNYAAGPSGPSTLTTVSAAVIPPPTAYIVHYSAGTGSGVYSSDTFTVGGSAISLPSGSALTKTSYTFAGWSDGTTTLAGSSSYSPTSSVTLTAQWTAIPQAVTPTLHFVAYDANEGSGSTPSDVNAHLPGASVNVQFTSLPTLDGYNFAGWCILKISKGATCESFFGTLYAPSGNTNLTMPDANVTLYAVWSLLTPTITSLSTDGVCVGDNTTTLTCPPNSVVQLTLTGSNFGSSSESLQLITYGASGSGSQCSSAMWISSTVLSCVVGNDVGAGQSVRFIINLNGGYSLPSIATYTGAKTYTVSYSAGSDSGSYLPIPFTVGDAPITLPSGSALTRVGYTFAGWSDGTTTFAGSSKYSPTGNISLNAVWAVKKKTTSQISLNLSRTSQIVGSSDRTTLSTTITGSEPTGTLTITLNSASSILPIKNYTIDVTPTNGTNAIDLTTILSSQPVGTYSVKASYTGDSQNSSAVASSDFKVNAQLCTTGETLLSSGYCGAAPGYFGVTKDGVFSVKPCAKGSYSSKPGATTCTKAPAATYVAKSGATIATHCLKGQSTRAGVTGATKKEDCSAKQISITTESLTTTNAGDPFEFSVKAAGAPLITVTETGRLPEGVIFKDLGNGTAKLSGTPSATAGGEYPLTFTAKNTVSADTPKLQISLTVNSKPAFTSGNAIAIESAALSGPTIKPLNFIVRASGYPIASISTASTSTSSKLPDGVSLVDNHDGTATLQGTPAAGSGGKYSIEFVATNSNGTTTQPFTLTVPTIIDFSLDSHGLCVGDGTTTLLYCPVSGIPTLTISFVCNVATCSGPLGLGSSAMSECPGASLSPATITAGMTGQVLNCSISPQVGTNTISAVLYLAQGGESKGSTITFRTNAAAPILPPVITSLDSSTCIGRVLSGTNTVGFTGCPSSGSSILINGRNFFYTTTVTPGLCSNLYYVTFFQLLCLLNPLSPGAEVYVQAFTPGMGQTAPTGFSVTGLAAPVISSLQDASCTGNSVGLALTGCPSVGGSNLVIKFSGTVLPSATVTTGLCSNVVWVDSTTLSCTLSTGIAPGTTISVVVKDLAGVSTTVATISF